MTQAAPRFFSLSDRIGRLRYFTYTLAAMLVLGLALVPIYLLSLLLPAALGKLVSTVAFILVKNVMIPLVVFVMSIRRLHDFDAAGWWVLTVIVPFVTFAFLIIPGNREANRFGPPPPPNSDALKFAAAALPVAVLGLYFFMVSINPPPHTEQPPAKAGAPALRSYPQK